MKIIERKWIGRKEVTPFGAFPVTVSVTFSLTIPRTIGATDAVMEIFDADMRPIRDIPLDWTSMKDGDDCYRLRIVLSDVFSDGLYRYRYRLSTAEGEKHYGARNADGQIARSDGTIPLTVYRENGAGPEWLRGGMIYHIFVDRFRRSGKCAVKPGAILNEDWENGVPQYAEYPGGDVENNMFFGGDLYGIAEKLDYIRSLGTTALYLSPIFDAYSNHKYDTADYLHVDEMFGGDEALAYLIREAKKRGISVILDGVFNHTGADSIYFNRYGKYPGIGAYQSGQSPYSSWYTFRKFPDDYECWWNVKILPRVRSDDPGYRHFLLGQNGVVEKWTSYGVRGWRLDVADELSDGFLTAFREKERTLCSDGVVYGEVWEDASDKIAYGVRKKYLHGNELDSVMNYPLRNAVIAYLRDGDAETLRSTVDTLYFHYPKPASDLLMNFLGTHDTERILTVLGGRSTGDASNSELKDRRMTPNERENALSLLKLGYLTVATLPGVPCVFYGDEAGMEGYRDPFNRMPYPWGREDRDLIAYFRKVAAVRRREPLYRDGWYRTVACTEDIYAFLRYGDKTYLMTVINRSPKTVEIRTSDTLTDLFSGRTTKRVAPMHGTVLKCSAARDPMHAEFAFFEKI